MAETTDNSVTPGLNPNALSLADTARLLSKVGGQSVTEAMLQDDIDAGAPTNPGGTLNLVIYAAWLVREMAAHKSYGD